MIHILSISGSLRAQSSNTALLQAAARLAPRMMTIVPYEGLAHLPHFNPDLEETLPASVQDLRDRVADADALLISCPEYARGIPGSFKNALDWLVGSSEFPGRKVALFNASPRAADAQAALRLVLRTMSAEIVEEASVTLPLLATPLTAEEMAREATIATPVRTALTAFIAAIARGTERV